MVGPSGYYGLGSLTRCLNVLLAAPALSPQAGFAQANVVVCSEGVPAGAAVPTYLNAGGSYEASAKGSTDFRKFRPGGSGSSDRLRVYRLGRVGVDCALARSDGPSSLRCRPHRRRDRAPRQALDGGALRVSGCSTRPARIPSFLFLESSAAALPVGGYRVVRVKLLPDPFTGDAHVAQVLGGSPRAPGSVSLVRSVKLDVEFDVGVLWTRCHDADLL
jgi:hypothetical protein